MTTLKKGSRGSEVKQLQTLLVYVAADGIFGEKTEAAVIAFQTAHNLTADGIVGPNTWRVLLGGDDPKDIIVSCEDLKQFAEPHGSKIYGKAKDWGTYSSGACGPTSMAICYRALGLAPSGETASQTILRLGQYAVDKGYRIKGNGTSASLFKTNGLAAESVGTQAKIENAVRAGKLVILHIGAGFPNGYGGKGHYLVAYSIQGDKLLLRDVGSSKASRQSVPLAKVKTGLKGAYIITKR